MDKELRNDLFTNIENYNQQEVINNFYFVSFLNFLIAMAKGYQYQSSWCKKGLFSISQNLERKYSRMDNMMFPMNGNLLDVDAMGLGKKESLLNTISDEANYCNLALVFFLLKGKNNKKICEISENFLVEQLDFVKANFNVNEINKNYLDNVCEYGIELLKSLQKIIQQKDGEQFHKYLDNLQKKLLKNDWSKKQ